ncbi:hypothetical protein V5799_030181 [Amblyomma americanum]|uniref:Galactosylgalactosylxylosylprotein 3-beta-glucuronosyltransferase n=1 Tax=Amblyomma americanum TaxID=6943 RepID=A0AAQ4EPI5_AMBAM
MNGRRHFRRPTLLITSLPAPDDDARLSGRVFSASGNTPFSSGKVLRWTGDALLLAPSRWGEQHLEQLPHGASVPWESATDHRGHHVRSCSLSLRSVSAAKNYLRHSEPNEMVKFASSRQPEVFNGSVRNKGRGVSARRTALAWLQANATLPGVLYFADDDNSYDHRLFDEIRWTQGVSVFPVGSMLVTGVSSPVVVDGAVVGFHDPYIKKRRFAVDMAGFAVNLRLLLNNSHVYMPHMEGYQETVFLESLNISISDLEPLCENATKVRDSARVWRMSMIVEPTPRLRRG